MPRERIEHRQAKPVAVERSDFFQAIGRAHDPHLRNGDVVRPCHPSLLQRARLSGALHKPALAHEHIAGNLLESTGNAVQVGVYDRCVLAASLSGPEALA